MAVVAGLQYVKTLEDLYREGDPEIPLKFDNSAGIKALNSVFYRRNQEELDDSADALVLAQYKALQHRRWAGNTGMSEDQARMLEDRRAPRAIMAPGTPGVFVDPSAPGRPAGDYVDADLDDPADPAHPVVQEAVAVARETHAQEVSRRAQFAQVASAGLSAASGAAESMIGHTASALRLIPAAAGVARDATRDSLDFWGPQGPAAGVAAQGLIMAAGQARRNQIEYQGYMAQAWSSSTPLRNALGDWLVGHPPSLIADATPEQEMRKALDYQIPGTAPAPGSSSSSAAIGDWDTHIFGPRAGLPIQAPPKAPSLAVPQGAPLPLMPPPSRATRSKAASAPPPRPRPPHSRPKSSTPHGPT